MEREEVKKEDRVELSQLFKLKSEKDVKRVECVKKLGSDDVSMMGQLIKKYGDDFKVGAFYSFSFVLSIENG